MEQPDPEQDQSFALTMLALRKHSAVGGQIWDAALGEAGESPVQRVWLVLVVVVQGISVMKDHLFVSLVRKKRMKGLLLAAAELVTASRRRLMWSQ